MYNVLHIMGCSDVGGISTVVLNYYKYINRSKIHFDIAFKTNGLIGRNGRKIESLGANIYYLPLKSCDLKMYICTLKKILDENNYDAIHIHEGETSFVALKVAKQSGIPQRIAHSHTSSPDVSLKSFLKRNIGQILNYYYATNLVGCGRLAAERVFGKRAMKSSKCMILPNSVDTDIFFFNPILRNEIRKEMNIEDRLVIGMVGRLSPEKNFPFALDLIERLHHFVPNAVLFIVGDGIEKEKLMKIIAEKEMDDYVTLLGNRNDVNKLYNVFDVFLLTSFHEGFPVVAVEAMACGLPTLLSDTITKELSFGEKVFYLPLNDKDEWIKIIRECITDHGRAYRQHEIVNNNLDIRGTVGELERLYLNRFIKNREEYNDNIEKKGMV